VYSWEPCGDVSPLFWHGPAWGRNPHYAHYASITSLLAGCYKEMSSILALLYEPKCGGRGGLLDLSQWSPNKLWRSNSKFTFFSESIEWFIEDKAFLRSYDLAPSPSPLSHQLVVYLHQSSSVSPPTELIDGRVGEEGSGEELNHTIARKPGPLYIYKLFKTLWFFPLNQEHEHGTRRSPSIFCWHWSWLHSGGYKEMSSILADQ
jgi:hypothetical protein